MSDILLKTENLQRVYQQGGENLTVLHNADIEIKSGEIVALVGPSGSGKSTLLRCINRLIEPTAGRIIWNGLDVTAISEEEIRYLRRRIGMTSHGTG